jgi:2,5-diketo-D-gluconate reductase B
MTESDGFRLGLGTWQFVDPETCARSVAKALETGYRHLDSAQTYLCEEYVGQGFERADVPREEVTVATKVSPANLSYDDVVRTGTESRDRLGVETIDLLYVHWPRGAYEPEATMQAFNELRDRGVIEHIGVSNFSPEQFEAAQQYAETPIFANQVRMNPYSKQRELLEYAQENDIWLVAYSPLARGDVFDDPTIGEIAEKHGVSEAQVSIAWLLSKENVAAIPKATGDHVQDNYEARELELDDEDIARIESLEPPEEQ